MARISMADLEKMTTHEVSDLLADVVMILRRLPNVPVQQLQAVLPEPVKGAGDLAARVRHEPSKKGEQVGQLPDWVEPTGEGMG